MEIRAVSRRRHRQPRLDLSAEAGTSTPSRDDAAAQGELFDGAWDETDTTGNGWAPVPNVPDLSAAGPASSVEELPHDDPASPADKVLLSVGRPYFHDGTVGEGRYEADLAPTLLAGLAALQVLARAVFAQFGAPPDAELTVVCDRWTLRLGPEGGQAQLVELEEGAPSAPRRTERRADQWLRGVASFRQADHAQALSAFEAEAAAAVDAGSPQRAAIAFRAAATSARSTGRADQCNRLLRLAGKSYLEIAEGANTLPQGVFSAYREAARAFLEAGNLPLAQQCLTKALAVGEGLGMLERA
jgi:hypothetical protein